jgi:hypothetical protein
MAESAQPTMFTTTPYSGDQFGYYTVGTNFRTYSKLLAAEEMARTGIHLEWHFNKPQYESHNWTQEPGTDLKELYRQRAQQIRDNYDYIVVWYSGGPDSWCVLDSFINNGIKVDEIAQFHSYGADGDRHNNLNEEVFFTAVPETKKILERDPAIKHRTVDLSEIIPKVYLRPDVKFDFIYNIKGIASANSFARAYMRDYIQDYQDLITAGKRLCFIWGTDKPRIMDKDGKYHTYLIDAFSETNIRIQELANQGYYDEWFFWGPDSAQIIIKQCHLLMHKLKGTADQPWFTDQKQYSHAVKSKEHGRYLRNDIYHTTIYPGWNPNTLVAPKPINLMLSERDDWFWKQTTSDDKNLQYARNGVKEVYSRYSELGWLNNKKDWTRGVLGAINTYCLEP